MSCLIRTLTGYLAVMTTVSELTGLVQEEFPGSVSLFHIDPGDGFALGEQQVVLRASSCKTDTIFPSSTSLYTGKLYKLNNAMTYHTDCTVCYFV